MPVEIADILTLNLTLVRVTMLHLTVPAQMVHGS